MGLISTVEEGLTEAVTQDAPFSIANGWVSLHSADPGPTGANEVTSGTGPDARQPVTFAGSGGTDANTGALTYTFPGSASVTWVGLWDAQTGGTFIGGFPCVGNTTIGVAIAAATTVYAPAHGFSPGDIIRPSAVAGIGSSLPSPLVYDTPYQVSTTPDADTLTLCAVGGGPDISFTGSGGFQMGLDYSQTLGGGGGLIIIPNATGLVYSTVS